MPALVKNQRFLPSSRVAMVDLQTGLVTATWYKFFDDLNIALGGDSSDNIGNILSGAASIGGNGSLSDQIAAVEANAQQAAASAASTSTLSATKAPTNASAVGQGVITTNVVNITASGGAGGYTYATSFVSGDAGITILNGATAAPSFSAQATPIPKSAIYKTVVTSGADTFEVTYSVYIERSSNQ